MGLSRVLLFVLNFVVFLCGLAAIAFGVYVAVQLADDKDDIGELIGGAEILGVAAWVFAGVAVAIMVAAFAGCFGAWKESTFLLVIYIVLLTVLVVLEFGAGAVVVFYGSDIEDQTSDWLFESMREYGEDAAVAAAWDKFQEKFECCAVNKYDDWLDNGQTSIPASCCDDEVSESQSCPGGEYFEKGCKSKVVELIEDNLDILMYAAIGLVAVQLLSLILACCAINSFRKDVQYS